MRSKQSQMLLSKLSSKKNLNQVRFQRSIGFVSKATYFHSRTGIQNFIPSASMDFWLSLIPKP